MNFTIQKSNRGSEVNYRRATKIKNFKFIQKISGCPRLLIKNQRTTKHQQQRHPHQTKTNNHQPTKQES